MCWLSALAILSNTRQAPLLVEGDVYVVGKLLFFAHVLQRGDGVIAFRLRLEDFRLRFGGRNGYGHDVRSLRRGGRGDSYAAREDQDCQDGGCEKTMVCVVLGHETAPCCGFRDSAS